MTLQLSAISSYVRSYYTTTFNGRYMLVICLLLSGLLLTNYYYTPLRELADLKSWSSRFINSWLIYFIPFALSFWLQPIFYQHTGYLRNKWLVLLIIISPTIFALRVNTGIHHAFLKEYFQGDLLIYWLHCTDWIIRSVFILMVLYAIRYFSRGNYSYSPKAFTTNMRPYLWLIVCFVPFILIAVSTNSFSGMYPRAAFVSELQLPRKLVYYTIFELSYAFDFISIEAFFRGLLIFAFMRICGARCIVPAACFYCCIHLGKPMGEAIGSFWGGMLLGIISYYTKNIWGGIIVHIGIAAVMELAGAVAQLL